MRIALLALLSGCAVNVDTYPDKAANAWCDALFACNAEGNDYASRASCRTSVSLSTGQLVTERSEQGCTVDEDLLEACLDAVREVECDGIRDVEPMCPVAWTCET